MLIGDSRVYFCNHGASKGSEGKHKIVFGGAMLIDPSERIAVEPWRMSAATVAIIPQKLFEWEEGTCGLTIQQLMLSVHNLDDWEEIKLK